MITQIIYLSLWVFLHPIKMFRTLKHCQVNDHKFNMYIVNFNYDVWCSDCGEIFSDEVR